MTEADHMLDKSRTNDGNNSEHAYATTCPTSREIDSETTPSHPIGLTADVCVPVGAHTRSANASLSLNARQIFHPTICRAFSLRRRPRVKRATGTFHRLAASRVSRRNPSTRKRSHSSFSPCSSLRETLTITWPVFRQIKVDIFRCRFSTLAWSILTGFFIPSSPSPA